MREAEHELNIKQRFWPPRKKVGTSYFFFRFPFSFNLFTFVQNLELKIERRHFGAFAILIWNRGKLWHRPVSLTLSWLQLFWCCICILILESHFEYIILYFGFWIWNRGKLWLRPVSLTLSWLQLFWCCICILILDSYFQCILNISYCILEFRILDLKPWQTLAETCFSHYELAAIFWFWTWIQNFGFTFLICILDFYFRFGL